MILKYFRRLSKDYAILCLSLGPRPHWQANVTPCKGNYTKRYKTTRWSWTYVRFLPTLWWWVSAFGAKTVVFTPRRSLFERVHIGLRVSSHLVFISIREQPISMRSVHRTWSIWRRAGSLSDLLRCALHTVTRKWIIPSANKNKRAIRWWYPSESVCSLRLLCARKPTPLTFTWIESVLLPTAYLSQGGFASDPYGFATRRVFLFS